jgi:hypothetical protein
MNKHSPSVIKSDEVKISGRVRLGAPEPHTNTAQSTAPVRESRVAGAAAARIVRTAPDHVIIEVCCPCGTKTMLRCNY